MQTADLNSLQVGVYFSAGVEWSSRRYLVALLPVLIHASLEIRGAGSSVCSVGRRPSKRPVWENPEIKSKYPISRMKTDRPSASVRRPLCLSESLSYT